VMEKERKRKGETVVFAGRAKRPQTNESRLQIRSEGGARQGRGENENQRPRAKRRIKASVERKFSVGGELG